MSEPDNRPRGIDEIIADLEVVLDQLKTHRAREREGAENARANMEAVERRKSFGLIRRGPPVAAAVLLADWIRRTAKKHSQSIATFGAGATVATATVLGIGQFGGGPLAKPPILAEPAPPLPPRVGPPKGRPHSSPVRPPALTRPAVPSTYPSSPPDSPAPLPVPLPDPLPDPLPSPPTPDPTRDIEVDGEPTATSTCWPSFPRLLRRGLMCGPPH